MIHTSDENFVFEAIRTNMPQERIVELLASVHEIDPGIAGTRVHNALVRLRSAGRIRSKTVHEVVE